MFVVQDKNYRYYINVLTISITGNEATVTGKSRGGAGAGAAAEADVD